jgi:hypothetical protein
MRDDEAPGKDNAAPAAGEAPGAGRRGYDREGLVGRLPIGANAAGEAACPVGVLIKPAATDTCEVYGADSKQYRVTFTYRNYRGETSTRLVIPSHLAFGATKWHLKPQWLLEAHDCLKNAPRTFAVKDISDWDPAP